MCPDSSADNQSCQWPKWTRREENVKKRTERERERERERPRGRRGGVCSLGVRTLWLPQTTQGTSSPAAGETNPPTSPPSPSSLSATHPLSQTHETHRLGPARQQRERESIVWRSGAGVGLCGNGVRKREKKEREKKKQKKRKKVERKKEKRTSRSERVFVKRGGVVLTNDVMIGRQWLSTHTPLSLLFPLRFLPLFSSKERLHGSLHLSSIGLRHTFQ